MKRQIAVPSLSSPAWREERKGGEGGGGEGGAGGCRVIPGGGIALLEEITGEILIRQFCSGRADN